MITPFSLLLAMGAVLGLGWCTARLPPKDALEVADQGLLALLGALVGGRLGYIAINWGYFQSHLVETWQVWLGGLSGIGAIIGFGAALFLMAWVLRQHPGALADRLLPLGLSLAASAWLAAWWAGSAYGIQASSFSAAPWLALPARDESGAWSLRLPTQLAGALLTLGLWIVLERLKWLDPSRRSHSPGRASAFALLGLGAILFLLAYTRVDPTLFWRGMRLDAWAGLGLIALGLLAFLATLLPLTRPNPA